MKSLRQSLIDYELPLLKAIADQRAVLLTAGDHTAVINQLVETLLSPVATAIVLDDLSPAESQALEFLLQNGGQVEGPRFNRQFGEIRSMGPARLSESSPGKTRPTRPKACGIVGLSINRFKYRRKAVRKLFTYRMICGHS